MRLWWEPRQEAAEPLVSRVAVVAAAVARPFSLEVPVMPMNSAPQEGAVALVLAAELADVLAVPAAHPLLSSSTLPPTSNPISSTIESVEDQEEMVEMAALEALVGKEDAADLVDSPPHGQDLQVERAATVERVALVVAGVAAAAAHPSAFSPSDSEPLPPTISLITTILCPPQAWADWAAVLQPQARSVSKA